MDQAVQYFGTHVENELDKIGHKTSAKERRTADERKRKLEQLLDPNPEVQKPGQFLDPAIFFQ